MSKLPYPLVWAFWAHEPIQFYQRRHADLHSPLGTGRWTPLWYDRIHSREAIARMADAGVNLFYSHFYKGFGLAFEHDQMMRTAEIVQYAHEFGIRVCAYCTIGTVYHETLLDEFPETLDCVAKREDGLPYHPGFEGGFNSRCFTCYSDNPYWQDYYPKILRFGLETVGVDGFHFDNATERPCHCPHCTAEFRAWLAENAGDPRDYALASWRHVCIPSDEGALEPIYILWRKFRRERCRKRHGMTFRLVKSIDPEAIVLYNPGLGRFSETGYEPLDTPPEADLSFIEAPTAIRITPEGGHTTTVAGFNLARLVGIQTLNASWYHNDYSLRIPETPEEIALYEAEHFVYGGAAGSHWLGRPTKHGAGMVLDDPMQFDLQKTIFHYFKDHAELYAKAKHEARMHVLYSPESLHIFPGRTRKGIMALSERLRAAGVPWDFVTADGQEPPADELVLLPDVLVLSDEDAERLHAWRCRIHAIGDAGLLDEHGVERENPVFADAGEPVLASPFGLDFPDGLVETAIAPDGDRLIHLINMRNTDVVDELHLTLPFDANSVQVYSFEPEATAEMKGQVVTVRNLKTLVTLKFSTK
ncbi:MAG: hypothetical protein J6X55_00265 [Victivallales bacterium]|nr:hypothetical protein [Victivallales bacterium]